VVVRIDRLGFTRFVLKGIEKYGVGNWKVISEKVDISKTVKQMEDHYWQLYLGVHGYCLPCQYTTLDGVRNVADSFPHPHEVATDSGVEEPVSDADLYRIPVAPGHVRGEMVQRDREVGRTGSDRSDINAKIAQLPGNEIPGFMPLRQDFEVEYENDAELLLADMEFSPDDHPSERELKLQVIRIYNQKLEERTKRRKFVIERGLVNVKEQQAVSLALALCSRLL
jgi:transcriptional adapter 2-alpha